MAGVIDDGGIGTCGVLGKALEVAAEFSGIAVGRAGDVEAQVLQQALDVPGIAFGIDEGGKVLVLRLADDQGHAAQGSLLRLGRQRKA